MDVSDERLAWVPEDPLTADLIGLVDQLADHDGREADRDAWPEECWALIELAGGTRWSIPAEFGGLECLRPLLLERYARLAGGSLTAVFILSQHDAALRRLVSRGSPFALDWVSRVASEGAFVTVGLSHLTTSRRLGERAVRAAQTGVGFELEGVIPWVTAACRADLIVTGAALDDGRQILVGLPTDRPGVQVQPPFELAALQASATTEVVLDKVAIDSSELLAGPSADLLTQPGALGTAGVETSALALGQAHASIQALGGLRADRPELEAPFDMLADAWCKTWSGLIARAGGEPDAPSPSELRTAANRLALRSTQAFLTARKGSGFLRSDPAQRWARQALFFLVWSCPSPVARAALCELAAVVPE